MKILIIPLLIVALFYGSAARSQETADLPMAWSVSVGVQGTVVNSQIVVHELHFYGINKGTQPVTMTSASLTDNGTTIPLMAVARPTGQSTDVSKLLPIPVGAKIDLVAVLNGDSGIPVAAFIANWAKPTVNISYGTTQYTASFDLTGQANSLVDPNKVPGIFPSVIQMVPG